MCAAKTPRLLNEEEKITLTLILENYLQLKKTWWGAWWGRTPNPLFDTNYFNQEIAKKLLDKELKDVSFQYFDNLFEENSENKKDILYFFNKGNIFFNIYYAALRVIQRIIGFFLGGGQDRYLDKVKKDFKEIINLGENERKRVLDKETADKKTAEDLIAKQKVDQDLAKFQKRKQQIQELDDVYKQEILNMNEACSVIQGIIKNSSVSLSKELKNLSSLIEQFTKTPTRDLREEILAYFLSELKIVLTQYANMTPEGAAQNFDEILEKRALPDQISKVLLMLKEEKDRQEKAGVASADEGMSTEKTVHLAEDASKVSKVKTKKTVQFSEEASLVTYKWAPNENIEVSKVKTNPDEQPKLEKPKQPKTT